VVRAHTHHFGAGVCTIHRSYSHSNGIIYSNGIVHGNDRCSGFIGVGSSSGNTSRSLRHRISLRSRYTTTASTSISSASRRLFDTRQWLVVGRYRRQPRFDSTCPISSCSSSPSPNIGRSHTLLNFLPQQ
jgi:hypothetical protein